MKEMEKDHGFILSTGRAFYAYECRLTPWARRYSGRKTAGTLAYGYDGVVEEIGAVGDDEDTDPPLTEAERREVADCCIAEWERWARGEEHGE